MYKPIADNAFNHILEIYKAYLLSMICNLLYLYGRFRIIRN